MQTLQILIAVALVIAIVAFIIITRRGSGRQRPQGSSSARAETKHARHHGPSTAGDLLTLVSTLRTANAQWPEILSAINPAANSDLAELLHTIRGPHMFDPRTALGVLETGARNVPSTAPIRVALAAARDSMDKVVSFGR